MAKEFDTPTLASGSLHSLDVRKSMEDGWECESSAKMQYRFNMVSTAVTAVEQARNTA